MKNWQKVLIAIGTVLVGGTFYTIATTRPGVNIAVLIDGGVRSDCVKRQANCSLLHNGVYVSKLVEIAFCNSDRTIVVPPRIAASIVSFDAQCERTNGCAGCDAGPWSSDISVEDEADIVPPCRCWGAPGQCRRRSDAGFLLHDTTYAAADVVGAGCTPKTCVEVQGFPSMPEECK